MKISRVPPDWHRLATLEHGETLGAKGCQGALAPDEPLDGAVGEHDGLVARLGRGGPLSEHHAGMHEGHAIGLQLLGLLA